MEEAAGRAAAVAALAEPLSVVGRPSLCKMAHTWKEALGKSLAQQLKGREPSREHDDGTYLAAVPP